MAKLIVKTRKDRLREAWAALRAERDRRLAATDWIVVKYAELGQEMPEEWRRYRQALRDLPATLTDEQVLAGDIPWPTRPDEAVEEEGGEA